MYTLPNLLTLFRFGLIPVFLILFFSPLPLLHWAATGVFLLAAITDWLDGWLARLLEQESALGRLADPLADKLLSVSVFLAIWIRGLPWGLDRLAVTSIAVIAVTELVIATLSGLSAWRGIEIRPSPVGKTKTAVQFLALLGTLLLVNLDQTPGLAPAPGLPARPLWVGAAFVLCALLTLATLAVYIARYPDHREQLRMVRQEARRRARLRRQTVARVVRMSPGPERRQEALEAAREIAREIARAPQENLQAGSGAARGITPEIARAPQENLQAGSGAARGITPEIARAPQENLQAGSGAARGITPGIARAPQENLQAGSGAARGRSPESDVSGLPDRPA